MVVVLHGDAALHEEHGCVHVAEGLEEFIRLEKEETVGGFSPSGSAQTSLIQTHLCVSSVLQLLRLLDVVLDWELPTEPS